MHRQRGRKIAGVCDGATPLPKQHRRHHLDQRAEDRILRRDRHRPMEVDVVHEILARIVERGRHSVDAGLQARDVFVRSTFGSERCDAHFELSPRFEHFVIREAVQASEERERFLVQDGRTVGDIGARTVPKLQ
jgi:hypothetical protein